MSNEKIKVTVQNARETREYEGNLIHLNVFNSTEDGMELHGETNGSNFIPAAVVGGAAESVLNMITRMSRTPEVEWKLLTVMAIKLIERMEKLDKRNDNIKENPLSSTGIDNLLNSIFENR